MSDLADFSPRPAPGFAPIAGRTVTLEPIRDDRRFDELHEAFSTDAGGGIWSWLAYGPFRERAEFQAFAQRTYLGPDIVFHAIVPSHSGRAEGVAALMRTDRANGITEIGHVCFAPGLQKTVAATEAFFLMMTRVFDELGYRRLEWKCDSGNIPSRNAAIRLGFRYEGLFRQHMIVKGRNRDTAWYAILDSEWPQLKAGFAEWLAPHNFSADGRQYRSLATICAETAGSAA
ncbi:GNAT family N-acetyltransferase [Aurantimonas sp. VKM B-3413]|uniref:GNAT family N-acetyltransferase n=1 Tax=Aurantimonas sp. VKM B-3413 TaxID=2779401 RepID=UPI001E5E0C4C|nr:GNAT family protein [Aurantimonas sp. VKM B-3413]MCB8837064.1 GNAT family N-acetyltransferase [Aurantimonas sp. VKM B-3413]